ncbi:MAG: tyrosine-type recombinase/integrase [Collimonas sp.]|uniref:tyrosine-type recombinase/integrase n=1 Tax=Collimonas sp. TaxID=1963772 RepID=UPI003265F6AB
MGRPRKHNPLNLPPRVYAKHGAFYYHHPAPDEHWEHLGHDVEKAKKRAADIAHGMDDGFGTIAYYLDEFIKASRKRVAIGDLAQRTLDDYIGNIIYLKGFFGKMYPVGVEAPAVGEYLDTMKEAGRAVRANREKACLSACFTWMIRKGMGGVKSNPCIGVKRNKETKRERYVEDNEMRSTLTGAPVQVWALAELVYRTLQRPEDIIGWTNSNITKRHVGDKVIRIIRTKQGKTGAIVDIEITPEIDAVLARVKADKVVGMTLIHRRDFKSYTYDGLSSMLKRLQTKVRKEHKKVNGPLTTMPSWGYYDMKAKGATDMWLSGVPLEQIQVLCAHDSVTTTEIYCKGRWRCIVSPNKVVVAV